VVDKRSGLPLHANITVDNNPIVVKTDPENGVYYRLLLPGTYNVTVSTKGYKSVTVELFVDQDVQTTQNFVLETGADPPSPSSSGHGGVPEGDCPPDSGGAVIIAFTLTLFLISILGAVAFLYVCRNRIRASLTNSTKNAGFQQLNQL